MKIYTGTGDAGETGILGGTRLSKSHARIRALGSLDELNAALGMIQAEADFPDTLRPPLERVQAVLFELGAAVASPDPGVSVAVFQRETAWLESEIDRMEAQLPVLREFILPGGCRTGAALHWARTVARRAESQFVQAMELLSEKETRVEQLRWLNRLSDALFVMARTANHGQGAEERRWISEHRRARRTDVEGTRDTGESTEGNPERPK